MRLLFVCLGNICRSPTAEGTMRRLVSEAGLEGEIELDSAGTGAWHVGSGPDARATAAARARGTILEGRARKVTPKDFEDFDLVLAMDRENLRELRALARDEAEASKVHLLTEFDPNIAEGEEVDVPDPYYGGEDGVEEVLDLVEASCEGLLAQIRAGAVR
jgi:protein-tyrosine phosphatase